MPKLSPAQIETRRLEVLAACLRCFSSRGYQATTIEDLAREAGIATGTFYLYFENKAAALAAIAETNAERTAEFLASIEAIDDPARAIRRLFEAATEIRSDSRYRESMQLELQFWAHGARESEFGELIRNSLELWLKTLTRLIRRLERSHPHAEWMGGRTASGLARALFSLLNGYFLLAALQRRTARQNRRDREQLLETVDRLVGLG